MLCLDRRAGAAALSIACTIGVAAACGSALESASSGGPYPPYDGGSGFDGTGSSSGGSGDGSSDGTGGSGLPTTAIVVQGSPSLPDVRLCWSAGALVAPVVPFPGAGSMPASNYPGIPLGGAATMSDASALATPSLTLYALDAENLARLEEGLAQPLTCDQLVCGPGVNVPSPCLRADKDYWQIGPLSGSVQIGAQNLVALGGCKSSSLDPAATVARCGASWDATLGNLHADVLQLQPAATPAAPSGAGAEGGTDAGGEASAGPAGISVQAAQLSPGLASLEGPAGSAIVSFGAQDAGDAAVVVATLGGEGDLEPVVPQVVGIGTDLAAFGALGFAVDVPGLDGGAGHVWMSLAQAQQLVDPTQDPAQFFGQPRTYVVAVLGDPAAPHAFSSGDGSEAGAYDGKGLHVLVLASPPPHASSPDAGGEP